MRTSVWAVLLALTTLVLCLPAQTPSKSAEPPKLATAAMQVDTDLNRLMRGLLYPASNVVFSAQTDNPGDVKFIPGKDPSLATDPLTSTFGGWQAVENAALALTESANLLLIPGRKCANGVPVPMSDPDWSKFVQQLRDAGMKTYQLAQFKDQEKMVEAADILSAACAGCHRKWRDRPRGAVRCQ
jgi:hypothetical protein